MDRRDDHALISAAGHHRHDCRCHRTTIERRPATRTRGGPTEAQESRTAAQDVPVLPLACGPARRGRRCAARYLGRCWYSGNTPHTVAVVEAQGVEPIRPYFGNSLTTRSLWSNTFDVKRLSAAVESTGLRGSYRHPQSRDLGSSPHVHPRRPRGLARPSPSTGAGSPCCPASPTGSARIPPCLLAASGRELSVNY